MGGIVALLLTAAPSCALPQAAGVAASMEFRDGAWRLEARKGDAVLRRELRLPADDCALAADTAALVIDRFLRALGPVPAPPPPRRDPPPPAAIARASESDATPAPPAPPPSPIEAAVAPSEPARRVLLPEPEPQVRESMGDSPPRPWAFAVSAGAAGSLAGDDVRPGIWLDLTARTPGWALSLTLTTATGTADLEHRYGTSDMSLDSGLLAFSAKPCLEWWIRACAGPFAGARIISGDSLRESFLALQAEGGGALQLEHAFGGGFRFSAGLLVGYTAGPLSREAQAMAGSRLDVTAALTLGYQVF